MKLLQLWSFMTVRLLRLQFFPNSCRFFLRLFSADFSGHLLPFISADRICFVSLPVVYLGRLLSRCLSYLLLMFPSLISWFASFVPAYFKCFSLSPGMFLYFVWLICHLSRICPRLCSAYNLGCETSKFWSSSINSCRTLFCCAVLVWIFSGRPDAMNNSVSWENGLQSVTLTLKLSLKMPYFTD